MDRLYQEISDGLDRLEDGKAFERHVCELLRRTEWPTLVPIEGGQDAGMDGAAVDAAGEPVLLVATVSKGSGVIRNVKKNLQSHRGHGHSPGRVLVATSAVLSAARLRNIKDRIREMGYVPAHEPYAREAIAWRLYGAPDICKELLGVTGALPALSPLPCNLRPMRDLSVIGRDEDLAWVRDNSGDRLMVGQPGIGKTFLLGQLVQEGSALFAHDAGAGALADAIREHRPAQIIVEDAHVREQLLRVLLRHRAETGAEFTVVADCWPSHADDVKTVMGLTADQCRTLGRLSGREIVELIREAGIVGPDRLLDQLAEQADGCPGRAAMLTDLCLRKSLHEVWDGSELTRWIRHTFRSHLDSGAFELMATIALAGARGMELADAASYVELPLAQARQAMATLAAGGVVEEVRGGRIKVVPRALRWHLVKEAFFGTPSLPLEPVLARAPDLGSAVRALIGAAARGAAIDAPQLLRWVEQANDTDTWRTFAGADEDHVLLLLDRHPDRVADLLRPMLYHRPDLMIRRAIELAVGDEPSRGTSRAGLRSALAPAVRVA